MGKGENISLNSVAGKKKISRRPVVYISHLPHGFYEEELRSFFTQFGQVCRVKVSRSKKVNYQTIQLLVAYYLNILI